MNCPLVSVWKMPLLDVRPSLSATEFRAGERLIRQSVNLADRKRAFWTVQEGQSLRFSAADTDSLRFVIQDIAADGPGFPCGDSHAGDQVLNDDLSVLIRDIVAVGTS